MSGEPCARCGSRRDSHIDRFDAAPGQCSEWVFTIQLPMNPHQKPQEDVVVTQEDRDLAHEIMHHVRGYAVKLPSDRHWLIDLVTRHRLLGHEAGRRDMREAAGWQPIETAPAASGPDDERVLVIGGPFAEPQLVLPDGDWWRMRKSQGGRTFTHWMRPLPLPTEPLGGEG